MKASLIFAASLASLPTLSLAQSNFGANQLVASLNEMVEVEGVPSRQSDALASISSMACEAAGVALSVNLLEAFDDLLNAVDSSADEVTTMAASEEFTAAEIDAFREYGASEEVIDLLMANLAETRSISQEFVSTDGETELTLEEYELAACQLAFGLADPGFEDQGNELMTLSSAELDGEVGTPRLVNSSDFTGEEDVDGNIFVGGLIGVLDLNNGSFDMTQVADIADASQENESSTLRALLRGTLGLAAIAVDTAATLQTGGFATAVIGVASGGWGWNRVEESYNTLLNTALSGDRP